MVDTCVCCGEVIPEGRQICYVCENCLMTEDETYNCLPYSVSTVGGATLETVKKYIEEQKNV